MGNSIESARKLFKKKSNSLPSEEISESLNPEAVITKSLLESEQPITSPKLEAPAKKIELDIGSLATPNKAEIARKQLR
jgi:hypothetical protein